MKNVLEYLEASALRVPEKIAYSDENESITFAALYDRARAIGSALAHRFGQNRPIGVAVGRHIGTLCAFFGVLYSGNYYVPLDPEMPSARLCGILSRLDPCAVLYKNGDKTDSFPESVPLIACDEIENAVDEPLLSERRAQTLDIDPVYVIFTSGSTGTPKGIVISHRAVIDFIDELCAALDFRESDVFANQAPFYFDCSVKDIYLTLKLGAHDRILSKKLFLFPTLLIDELNRVGATCITWATSAFHLVASSKILEKKAPHTLRLAALGGEALLARHVNAWKAALPSLCVVNLYGPTEVTVDCTYHVLNRAYADDEPIPIGRAFRNKEVLLLNENLLPVKNGEAGEICVRGAGVAKGYFNEPEKTAAAFVQNPAVRYPDILYRTGDIGVKNADGDIVFQSRRDGQIKHMGYRIELGEIERALGGVPEIVEAICFYDAPHDRIVCAFSGEISQKELVFALSKRLPKYMIPNLYLSYEALPHNANGKIDRVKIRDSFNTSYGK